MDGWMSESLPNPRNFVEEKLWVKHNVEESVELDADNQRWESREEQSETAAASYNMTQQLESFWGVPPTTSDVELNFRRRSLPV